METTINKLQLTDVLKKIGLSTLKGLWYTWIQYCLAEIIYLCICWLTAIVTGGTIREANFMYGKLFYALSTCEAAMTIPIYTLLYCWFSAFVSFEKHNCWYVIPYVVYAVLIYPLFQDWEVTFYLTPIYGLVFYWARKWIIRILSNKPMLLKAIKITFNIIMVLIPIYYIITPLSIR